MAIALENPFPLLRAAAWVRALMRTSSLKHHYWKKQDVRDNTVADDRLDWTEEPEMRSRNVKGNKQHSV